MEPNNNYSHRFNAFDLLHEKYYELVYYTIHRKVDNIADVLDISQDVFIHIWEHRRILKNENEERLIRKFCKQFIARYYKAKDPLKFKEEIQESYPDPISDTNEKEHLLVRLQNCIDKLPEIQKQVIKLNKIDHIKRDEIAERLGLSIFTVKYHLSKAINYLKNCLIYVKQY